MVIKRKGRPYRPRRGSIIPVKPNRTNEEISGSQVRLVGDNVEQAVYPIKEALSMAQSMGLDLIEIFNKGEVPVCKIADYSKFLYDQKKKKKLSQSKSTKSVLKEVRFGPQTGDHDYEFKKRQILSFLNQKNKVRCVIQFRGRNIQYRSYGEVILRRLINDLSDHGKPEQDIRMEGNKMFMILGPSTLKLK